MRDLLLSITASMKETLTLIEITLIASEAYLKDKVTVTSRFLIVFLKD